MSEPKKTVEDLQKEFGNLVFKAGQLQYQIYALSKDLTLINEEARDLNLKAAAIAAEEKSNA